MQSNFSVLSNQRQPATLKTASPPPPAESKHEGSVAEAKSSALAPLNQQPAVLHFPWLSRVSAELEVTSKRKSAFKAPIMGENLNSVA